MTATHEEVLIFAKNHIAASQFLEFRRVEKYPSYWVSNVGHIISTKRKKFRFQKLCLNQGYHRANIGNVKPLRPKLVHRLVLEAFVCECPVNQQARHKNGIRHDNRISNLEWGTVQENSDDRTRHGTQPIGIRNPRAKLTEDQVRMIRISPKGAPELARELGVHRNMIYNIRGGLNWTNVV